MQTFTRAEIEDFLYHEAALLDDWRLEDWLALYTDDAELQSPLVCRVLDTPVGVVTGREELDRFLAEITRRRPSEDELPALYRTGTYLFDGHTLIWEYPRLTADGVDQLDLVEVMELDGPLIRRHRIYWGWRGTEHVIANAIEKATAGGRR